MLRHGFFIFFLNSVSFNQFLLLVEKFRICSDCVS